MAGTATDADAFVDAATLGKISVDPDSARAVLNKIRSGKDQVEALMSQTAELGIAPKLGENEVGHAIGAKYADRAVGGGESYTEALRNLYSQYQQVEQALETAINNYEEADYETADSFRPEA